MAYMIFAKLVVHVEMKMQLTISSTAEDYEIDMPEKTEVFLSLERVKQTVKVKCSLKL